MLLSYPVNVAVLPNKGLQVKLQPTADERQAMADDLEIVSVETCDVELVFKRWRRDGVSVKGRIVAQIMQECAVTLDPISNRIDEEIDRIFLPEGSKLLKPRLSSDGELLIDYDGQDEPESFSGDTLDAWEIALEHFALGIDPFARKEGVEFQTQSSSEDNKDKSENEEKSPFAALQGLIKPK